MPASSSSRSRSYPRRVAYWFLFAYSLLFSYPLIAEALPGVYALLEPVMDGQRAAVAWIAEKVFGVAITVFPAGSGDTAYNWFEVALLLATSLAIALVAGAIDRGDGSGLRRRYALESLLRCGLAAGMLMYGFAKVFPSQFAPITLDRLATPYGDSSPMGLLWMLMRYSRPYQVFGGLAEVACGLLLLLRRTTTLGAVGSAAVMAHVLALNLCFDVPVKLISAHLLLMSLALAAPDAWRLVQFFLLRREVSLTPLPEPFPSRKGRATRIWAEATVGALMVVASLLAATVDDEEQMRAFATPADMVGIYQMEALSADAPPPPPDWLRVTIGELGTASLMTADLRAHHVRSRVGEDGRTLTLALSDAEPQIEYLVRRDGDELILESALPGEPASARLRKLPTPRFLLTERGFNLVTERSFHR